jgi:hypothetical protein
MRKIACRQAVVQCRHMAKLVDEAVQVLRDLPENVQTAAARAILDYASSYDDDVQLSDEQAAEVERRIDDPNRTFLSLHETKVRLRHFGV